MVTTDFNVVVQWDGFAVNAESWDEEFLKYDYIGACWLWPWGGDSHRRGPIVGNGGFSLRSRRLFEALLELDPKWHLGDWISDQRLNQREYHVISSDGAKYIPEDLLICLWYRDVLEKEFGIRFCPPELANKFSVESGGPFTEYWLGRSFGFHSTWAASYYGLSLPDVCTDNDSPNVR